jgi:2-keto-4-pentenoate hydratase
MNDIPPIDPRIERGMQAQLRLLSERQARGEKLVGWKLGFGSPAAVQRLSLPGPLIGYLTDRVLLDPNQKISIAAWTRPVLEPEIVVRLGKPLSGRVDRLAVDDAVASIGPAFELADMSFPPDDVEHILAEDIYNRHIVAGTPETSRLGFKVKDLEARIFRNKNEIVRTPDVQALTGDILDLIVYMAAQLHQVGQRLRSGDLLMMGSIVPPLELGPSEQVEYELWPLGRLSLSIEG